MEYVLETRGLCKHYRHFNALDSLTMRVPKGAIYGLVGKNGSGKTMLLKAICGLITSTDGEVSVDGKKVGNGTYPESVGLVVGNIFLFEYMSAFKNLKMLNEISENKISDDEIRIWLKNFDLNPHDKRSIKKYSLGMCQKVSLIQAFMNKPDLIILDEPTNALDEASIEYLKKIITEVNKNSKTTFIIASHDGQIIDDISDEIITMSGGKIV